MLTDFLIFWQWWLEAIETTRFFHWPFTFVLKCISKSILIKLGHPKKYLPKFPRHKISGIEIFKPKKSCEQALHLGDTLKSRRARGTREETLKRGAGEKKHSLPRSLAARFARPNERAYPQAKKILWSWTPPSLPSPPIGITSHPPLTES